MNKWGRRLGCSLLIAIWLVIMLLPCGILTLIFNQEIVLQHSDLPDDQLRIWLIQETDRRGLGISTARRVGTALGTTSTYVTCVVTSYQFVLWEGSAEPAQSCTCYYDQSGDTKTPWEVAAQGAEACQLAHVEGTP